jgi:hypothetical protein
MVGLAHEPQTAGENSPNLIKENHDSCLQEEVDEVREAPPHP